MAEHGNVGNSNAAGNEGGDGAPEGNFRAMKTGEHVAADRWIEFIADHASDELKDLFKSYFERFRDRGADPAIATRLSILWSKADYNNMELIKSDFLRDEYNDDGEFVAQVFDSARDSAALQNERESRLGRREAQLSDYSRNSVDPAAGTKSIVEILSEEVENGDEDRDSAVDVDEVEQSDSSDDDTTESEDADMMTGNSVGFAASDNDSDS
jgi:hypothetical protein